LNRGSYLSGSNPENNARAGKKEPTLILELGTFGHNLVTARFLSFVFLFLFLHLGRAISYGSYFYNANTWFSGILLFFFLMATAFFRQEKDNESK